MQMRLIDTRDTTVPEIHEHICDRAVELAHEYILNDGAIPRKWRGPALMNGAPYNDGSLCLEIVEEFQGAPDPVKKRYRQAAVRGIQNAIMENADVFAGLILGEAKAGRSYFDRWPQVPTQLF